MDKLQRLIEELGSGNPEVRRKAAEALGKTNDPRATEALIATLKQGDFVLRYVARDSLVRIGKPAIGALIGALADKSIRYNATKALAVIGKPAIKPLIEALKDADLKKVAKEALAFGIGEPAIKPLVEALGDSAAQESAESTLVLMHLLRKPILGPLTEAIVDLKTQGAALKTLVDIIIHYEVDGRRSPILISVLSNTAIRGIVATHLASYGEVFIKPLIKAITISPAWEETYTNPTAGAAAMLALEKIGQPAIGPLIQALGNERAHVEARIILARIGKPAVEPLIMTLGEYTVPARDPMTGKFAPGDRVSSAAAAILGDIGDRVAVEPLIGALQQDSRRRVQLSALKALGKIDDARALMPLLAASENSGFEERVAEVLSRSRSLNRALHSFNEGATTFFCLRCLCRFGHREIQAQNKRPVRLSMCRKCQSISWLLENSARVVVVLDRSFPDAKACDNAQEDKRFRLSDGTMLSNLTELSNAFRNMSEQSYRSHVTDSKNDFANWVKDVLGEITLAKKLKSCSDRLEATLSVDEHIGGLRHSREKGMLLVNWFWRKEPLDFDEIHIKEVDDFEVEEFVLKTRNDMDTWRQSRYRLLPVYLAPSHKLSEAKLNLLRDSFGRVEVEETGATRVAQRQYIARTR